MKTVSDQLLLDCLRHDRDGFPSERLAALSADEWADLVRSADRHSLLPVLYRKLKPVLVKIIPPPDVQEQLRAAYFASGARNTHLYQELGQILTACRDAAVPVILLKGAHLARFVYGNIALRPMDDLDLLVKKADLPKVCDVFTKLGYMTAKEDVGQSLEHLIPFTKPGSVPVEIHFTLIAPPFFSSFQIQGVWERARTESIDGVEALSLSAEDLLLHLCLHVCVHHVFNNGLRPFFDISYTIDHFRQDLKWEVVAARAGEWGLSRGLGLALSLAEHLAGAPVPEWVPRGYEGDNGFNAKDVAEALIFDQGPVVASNIAKLFAEGGVIPKLAHFLRCTFPSKQSMATMIAGPVTPLSLYCAYFFRLKGLFERHGHIAWGLFSRDKEMMSSVDSASRRNALKDWFIASQSR